MKAKFAYLALPLLISTLALSACGGGGGGGGGGSSDSASDPAGQQPGNSQSSFTESQDWTVTFNQKDTSDNLDHARFCYDFVNGQQGEDTQCNSGLNWGLIVDNGQSPTFHTNGGVTNPQGEGAAFGFFKWSDLAQWQNATHDPSAPGTDLAGLYQADTANGVFSQEIGTNSWYAYDLEGTHMLYPNYNVYLITTDTGQSYDPAATTTYALQVIGYYGGPSGSQSGHITIRWIDVATPGNVLTKTLDATSTTDWVYFDLANNTVVDAPDASNWQIAFKRMDVQLNGGDSGSGHAGGFIARHIAGFYDADGNPVKAKFINTKPADTLADLTNTAAFETPADASKWLLDENSSLINPAYKQIGSWGDPVFYMDFGLYTYNPNGIEDANGQYTTPTHGLAPNDGADAEGAVLLRSGDGKSYARLHVTHIQYSTEKDAGGNEVVDGNGNPVLDNTGSQTWTFHFDVQPAQ